MKDAERIHLESVVLAPYMQKATALIGLRRRVGGNQFRHAMATFAILIDYHYGDPVLLKAALLHDLFEDVPRTDPETIRTIDADGPAVVRLVLEVTRGADESKEVYLSRVRDLASPLARTLKVADRISNLTDLHGSVFKTDYVLRYLEQTERFVLPMAAEVNAGMQQEISDLLELRRAQLASLPPPVGVPAKRRAL